MKEDFQISKPLNVLIAVWVNVYQLIINQQND